MERDPQHVVGTGIKETNPTVTKMKQTRYYDIVETEFGWMGLLASGRGVRRTTLPQPSSGNSIDLLGPEANSAKFNPKYFAGLKSRLHRYFESGETDFNTECLDLSDAPPFVRSAWEACRAIPVGQTRTYLWLASRAGRPSAARAAGQSMARNRLPIMIPCHRVTSSDGSLGGFGRGASQLELKRRLLDLESG